MLYPTYPQPHSLGSKWAISTSATTVYPTTGAGGVSATPGDSHVEGKRVIVLGYTSNGVAGTLTLTDGAGVDVDSFVLAGATQSGVFQRFARGIELENGFGFRNTGGASVRMWYVRI